MTSVLPGALVQSLVTAVQPDGLLMQVLGYFDGTVDQFHLPPGDPEELFQVGQKLRARVLYSISPSSPPRFALSLAPHIVQHTTKSCDSNATRSDLREAYPVGTVLEGVKVIRVESERGIVVELSGDVEGFVHVCWHSYWGETYV